jgi:hypothetical protein
MTLELEWFVPLADKLGGMAEALRGLRSQKIHHEMLQLFS